MILAQEGTWAARPRTKTKKSHSTLSATSGELNRAIQLGRQGKYSDASIILFKLSRSPRFKDQRMQIRYLLGLMLYDMKLYQMAAFHFVDVIKQGNSQYIKKSLEKLSLAADKLGDETLLNYAMSKIDLKDFPRDQVDKLRFRIGEYQFENEQLEKAADNFSKVKMQSPLYAKAKYMQGLTLATLKKNNEAVKAFAELVDYRLDVKVTDQVRNAALMGLARAYYQKKDWESSIDTYRKIPKDTDYWHDAIFEISWAQMRSAQFRNVLSNMQSLHSPYYEDFYLPESILLRSLVYLYICEYDEMEKTLQLFEDIYRPIRRGVREYLKSDLSPDEQYKNMDSFIKEFNRLKKDIKARAKYKIPFVMARKIMKERDFHKTYNYVQKLIGEFKKMNSMPVRWQKSPMGVYSKKVLNLRLERAKQYAGELVVNHLKDTRKELLELFKQKDFARFEMLTGKKELARRKIVKKEDNIEDVEEQLDHSFSIQNGYEYYPFQGEYWLDEIGNYYYLGKQRCGE